MIAGCAVVHPALSFALDGSERATDKGEKVLRIASYNVGVFGKTEESSIDLIAGMMKELEPDMIALQELDSCANRSGKDIFQLEEFAKEMGDWHYRFARAIPFEGGGYGTGMAISPVFNPTSSFSVSLPQGQGAEAKDWTILSPLDATFPSTSPKECIDYIAILNNGAKYETVKAEVCRSFLSGNAAPASDPLPVGVEVRLLPSTSPAKAGTMQMMRARQTR